MQPFVDLQGGSGASYRFRLAPDGKVSPPIAGNYVYVRQEAEGFTVLAVEATNDLSSAAANWPLAVAKQGATHLFTRLNVSLTVREAEQRDIAAHYLKRPCRAGGQGDSAPPS